MSTCSSISDSEKKLPDNKDQRMSTKALTKSLSFEYGILRTKKGQIFVPSHIVDSLLIWSRENHEDVSLMKKKLKNYHFPYFQRRIYQHIDECTRKRYEIKTPDWMIQDSELGDRKVNEAEMVSEESTDDEEEEEVKVEVEQLPKLDELWHHQFSKVQQEDRIVGDYEYEGLQYKRCRDIYKIIIPDRLLEEMFRLAHEGFDVGHFALDKTLKRLSIFYHPKLRNKLKYFIDTCEVCERMKLKKNMRSVSEHTPTSYPLK